MTTDISGTRSTLAESHSMNHLRRDDVSASQGIVGVCDPQCLQFTASFP